MKQWNPVGAGTPDQRRRERWAMGTTLAALVFVLSYGGQRLGSLGLGEASLNEIVRSRHTAFYWRVALAALHALLAGPICAAVLPEPWIRPLLRFGPLWVIAPVMVLALAMVAFP